MVRTSRTWGRLWISTGSPVKQRRGQGGKRGVLGAADPNATGERPPAGDLEFVHGRRAMILRPRGARC